MSFQHMITLVAAISATLIGSAGIGQEPAATTLPPGAAQEKEASEGSPQGGDPARKKAEEERLKKLNDQLTIRMMFQSRAVARLMEEPAVQRELKLTRNQVDSFWILRKEYLARGREVSSASAGELTDPAVTQAAMNTLENEFLASMNQLLKPAQHKRLRQIMLQGQGTRKAFSDPEVQAQLGLTPEQEARRTRISQQVDQKLKTLQDARREMIASGTSIFDKKMDAFRVRQQQAENDGEQAFLALLTDRQRKVYQSALGETFDFNPILDAHRPRKSK